MRTKINQIGRRDFLKASALTSALTSGAFFINTKFATGNLSLPPGSPPTTPFISRLKFAPWAVASAPSPSAPPVRPEEHQRFAEFLPQRYYEISVHEVQARPHPQLGLSTWSSYGGSLPGPTFVQRYGEPALVRFKNELPALIQGFGVNEIITHLHNGNTASESDGFPTDFYSPGYFKDHHYANTPAGGNPNERKGTLWYHDHTMDFTAQNTYRGLSGFYLLFDDIDSGNEHDPNPDALRLPSGVPNGDAVAGCYDIPLLVTDRSFDSNGILSMDVMNMEGLLGDKYLVNGTVQPYFEVRRRKYRFRILCAAPARFFDLQFSNSLEFVVIANDGNLLPVPTTAVRHLMGPGERVDVVVDFSKLPASTTAIYMVNRADQPDGRGPRDTPLPLSRSPKLIMFKILPGAVEDPSRVPSVLRPQDPISAADIRDAVRRTWRFDRNGGAWTVNGNLFDPTRVDARVVQGRPEIWTISTSGGWWHPIHFHVEEGRILSVNGGEEGDTALLGRKDVFPLHGGDEMEVFVKFRDWIGKYPMHCHNSSHEDHAMMVRFDVVAPG